MFLSFIIPVYNCEKYLDECLQSLIKQNIDSKDYEIICINDGSTDGSLQILRKYEKEYPNIVVLNQKNCGVCCARNIGFSLARGDYIWWIDSDDFIIGNILGDIKSFIESNNCDKLEVGIYAYNNVLKDNERSAYEMKILKANMFSYDCTVWSSLLKTEFLKIHDISFKYPEISLSEDTIYMCEVDSCEPIIQSYPLVCYCYRQRSNSLMTSRNENDNIRRIKSFYDSTLVLKQLYNRSRKPNRRIANSLMQNYWAMMSVICQVDILERRKYLSKLKDEKMFPYQRPMECSLKKSYQTTRTDIMGKIYEFICMHSHTLWGYRMLCIFYKIRNKKRY